MSFFCFSSDMTILDFQFVDFFFPTKAVPVVLEAVLNSSFFSTAREPAWCQTINILISKHLIFKEGIDLHESHCKQKIFLKDWETKEIWSIWLLFFKKPPSAVFSSDPAKSWWPVNTTLLV